MNREDINNLANKKQKDVDEWVKLALIEIQRAKVRTNLKR
jgi:hypothetical protein